MSGNDRGGEPERVNIRHIAAIAKEMAERAPPNSVVAQRLAASDETTRDDYLRASNIEGAITSEDWHWIVKDTIPLATHALDAVQRWYVVRQDGRRARTMQVLIGETGRGKTLAAAWLLARVGGTYVTSEEMRWLKMSNYPAKRDEFARLARTRVLVVDDVGGELDAATAAGTLFEVVNHRQGLANGWTVLTGNLSVADFEKRFGIRTVRRIEHQGRLVEVEGPDLRRGRKS